MLFNTYEFIFLFLPLTVFIFHLIGKQGHHRIAIAWLVGASLFFYSWWNPAYLGLMLFSIIFNYGVGVSLGGLLSRTRKKPILAFGIAANLWLLGYFKYANFFVDNINILAGSNIILRDIILPLAISFFTFQQIAYLVDAYRGYTKEYNFLHYCLFVTFFPQLIAGPIVHHKEVLPQFARDVVYQIRAKHLAVGLTIFTIGLFKKVVFADGISIYATPVFNAAEAGVHLTFFESWFGALSYSLQLYFDFSGYSDMAIGLARMFGIVLPINFNSPYKATSIIDFWKRWHITLSRFLQDYLYIPLGGNRKGEVRRYVNIMVTMLIGGLWHGAGWTFVLWGGLHGMFIVINHLWRESYKHYRRSKLYFLFAWILTMLAVVISWVPFRATSMDGATNVLSGMIGINGFALPFTYKSHLNHVANLGNYLVQLGFQFTDVININFYSIIFIGLLFIVATVLPNTQQIIIQTQSAVHTCKDKTVKINSKWFEWEPTVLYSVAISIAFFLSILSITSASEFLYFQF